MNENGTEHCRAFITDSLRQAAWAPPFAQFCRTTVCNKEKDEWGSQISHVYDLIQVFNRAVFEISSNSIGSHGKKIGRWNSHLQYGYHEFRKSYSKCWFGLHAPLKRQNGLVVPVLKWFKYHMLPQNFTKELFVISFQKRISHDLSGKSSSNWFQTLFRDFNPRNPVLAAHRTTSSNIRRYSWINIDLDLSRLRWFSIARMVAWGNGIVSGIAPVS